MACNGDIFYRGFLMASPRIATDLYTWNYVARPKSKFPYGRLQKQNPLYWEDFCDRYSKCRANFNIFTSRSEKFVIPWDQLLYPYVVEFCLLGLEPLSDTNLHLSVNLKTLKLTGQEFLEL